MTNLGDPEPSITEHWHAIRDFTNRSDEIRCFVEYLNVDPPKDTILFFYGDGGNGKSLLLGFLRERIWQLPQACSTPYTAEQHGMIARWFRSLNEAYVWQPHVQRVAEARQAMHAWMAWSERSTPTLRRRLAASTAGAAAAACHRMDAGQAGNGSAGNQVVREDTYGTFPYVPLGRVHIRKHCVYAGVGALTPLQAKPLFLELQEVYLLC